MKKNRTRIFLLLTLIFLLVGLTTINATDNNQTATTQIKTQVETAPEALNIEDQTIKSENNKNKTIEKYEISNTKQEDDKITTTLTIEFVNDSEDELSTDTQLVTHKDNNYTINISLKENQQDTPISGDVKIYLDDQQLSPPIQIGQTGQATKTFTVDDIGYYTLYAEYEGNENYYGDTSTVLEIISEQYDTTLTIEKIDGAKINSTINITGYLYYDTDKALANQNLTIHFNNNNIANVTTDQQGKYFHSYKLENAEIQNKANITVEFQSPDDKYEDETVKESFDILKFENNIEVQIPQNNIAYSPMTIQITVMDENNNPYNGLLILNITDQENNHTYYTNNSAIVENGILTVNYTPRNASTQIISLLADEDEYHYESYYAYTFTVQPATLVLYYDYYPESFTLQNTSITGQLLNEKDSPISNLTISIQTDDEELGKISTDEDGRFNFTQYVFDSVEDDGYFYIYFVVDEDENHDRLYEEAYYCLSHRNVNVTLDIIRTNKVNRTIELQTKVTDSYDENIIPEGTMKIYVNDILLNDDIHVDNLGNANTVLVLGDNFKDDYILNVEAFFNPSNPQVYSNQNFAKEEVKFDETLSKIEIEACDTRVNTTNQINITLKDEYNHSINGNVTVLIVNEEDTIILHENLTLTDNQRSFTFTPQEEGLYTIYAFYEGIENITESSAEKNISVEKTPAIITLSDMTGQSYVNDTINMTLQLTDDDNCPIRNATIIIEIKNTTQSTVFNQTTDEMGSLEITYIPRTSDVTEIKAVYMGSEVYLENSTSKIIDVSKHNTTVIINYVSTTLRYEDEITISGQVIADDNQKAANGSVTIKLNDNTLETQILENGQYTLNHKVTEVGPNNKIEVIFNENEAYKYSNASITYNVEALATHIIINPIQTTTINDTIQVTGQLTDENNKALSAQLNLSINNQTQTDINVENGYFSFYYTPDITGRHEINLTYQADNRHYKTSSNSVTFNIIRADLTLSNPMLVVDNKDYTANITGKLTTTHNLNTSNITVTVSVGTNSFQTKTSDDGTFKITTTQLVADTYTITVHTDQTQYFNTLDQQLPDISLDKNNPRISLEEITDAVYDNTVTIKANVTDEYNRALNNTQVTITYQNTNYTTQTDENGQFTQEITVHSSGTNNITIKVEQTPFTNEITLDTSFEAQKEESILEIYENQRILPGDNYTISGQLLDKKGKHLANKTVIITINNKSLVTQTDQNGEFNITQKNAKMGTYNITAQFTDTNYTTNIAKTTINVTKLRVNLTVYDIISNIGDNITFKATLTDEYGNNVNGGNLVFKLNGRTLRSDDRFDGDAQSVYKFTIKDGQVEHTIPADLYLKHAVNITASYSGSYKYEGAKSNVALASLTLRKANLNLTINNTELKQYETVRITTKVTDDAQHNNYIDEGKVIYKLNNITLKDENGNVIESSLENGQASLDYNIGLLSSIDKNNQPRNYTITAIYYNSKYNISTNITSFSVERSPVTIDVSIVVTNNTLSVQGKLLDYLSNTLKGTNKLCVKINGITYKENTQNKYYNITDGIIDIKDIDITNIDVKSIEIVTGQRQSYLGARLLTNIS